MKKGERQAVYQKYNGHCAYCGKVIEYKEMQVDHYIPIGGYRNLLNVLPDSDPRKSKDNLMPSCRRCNHYKRAWHPEFFRQLILKLSDKLAKQYLYKVAIDYKLVTLAKWDGKFYFEKQEARDEE